jgi:hypothetical protein
MFQKALKNDKITSKIKVQDKKLKFIGLRVKERNK